MLGLLSLEGRRAGGVVVGLLVCTRLLLVFSLVSGTLGLTLLLLLTLCFLFSGARSGVEGAGGDGEGLFVCNFLLFLIP